MTLSKGAKKILQILRKKCPNNIVLEYQFPDLKGKNGRPLRFDFAVVNRYGRPVMLIEYDGEVHFQQIKHFHYTHSDFARAQERDRKKNKYCLMHGIPLYRIPYFEIDNVNTSEDIVNPKFLVLSKYHNDNIKVP